MGTKKQQQQQCAVLHSARLSLLRSSADLRAAASEVCVCAEVLTCQGGLVRTLTAHAGGLQTSGGGIDLKLVLSNLMITSRLAPPQYHGQRTVLTLTCYQITPVWAPVGAKQVYEKGGRERERKKREREELSLNTNLL